jgi:hypothetical protein
MRTLKLPKDKLDFFASVAQQFGEVHAPVEKDGKFVFQRLTRWSEARLDYNRTILPPKKYFLPPRETLFRYEQEKGYLPCTDGLDRRIVLFGVHACDIYALNILDLVFAGKYNDPYYQTRRKNTAIIGIDCVPDQHCFCRSMRADFVDRGFDLFFRDLGDYYLTFVGTARGDDMVLATGPLFEFVTGDDIDEYKRRSAEKRRAFELDIEIRDFAGDLRTRVPERTVGGVGQAMPVLRKLQHGLSNVLLLRRERRRGIRLARRQQNPEWGFLPVFHPCIGCGWRELPPRAGQPGEVPFLPQATPINPSGRG